MPPSETLWRDGGGRGTVGRVFIGTTGERLLLGAPCPVAVVPRAEAVILPRAVERERARRVRAPCSVLVFRYH